MGHVVRMGQMKYTRHIFCKKKLTEERCRCLWVDTLQMDYEDAGCSMYSSGSEKCPGGSSK